MSMYSHDPSGNHSTAEKDGPMNKLITWVVDLLHPMSSEEKIQKIWDKKPDNSILFAYHDAIGWITAGEQKLWKNNKTLQNISQSCQKRLNKYIIPQMMKRKLQGYKAAEVDAFMDDYIKNRPD